MLPVPRATVLFARLAATATFLTVALGTLVCATKSGFDCHAWPGCYADRFAPGASDIPAPLLANPALEMIHRVTAMTTGGLLIIAAVLVLRLPAHDRLAKVLSLIALAAAGGSALFGRASVLGLGVDAVGAAIDLFCALVAMSLAIATAVLVGRGGRFTLNAVASPALLASCLLVVVHVTGQLAAGYQSFTRCLSWPILWLASDDNLVWQIVRTGIAVAGAAALLVSIVAAARVPQHRVHAVVQALLLVGVGVLAVAYRATDADGGVLGVAFGLASATLLGSTVLLTACAAVRRVAPVEPAPGRTRHAITVAP